jgi:glycosyltransferase involved in cell wall biosynthesis
MLLSLIVPVYYEEDCIQQFINEVVPELEAININWEIIFIDDGSKDQTVEIIKSNSLIYKGIKLVEFSYNHGKHSAVTAGVKYSKGDFLLYMDPDLQDPPHEIKNFILEIEKGFDVVYGVRREKRDGILNRLFSKVFWSFLRKYTKLDIPVGMSVMRIFNRKFADKFLEYDEQNRFIEGIFIHIGMERSEILIDQRDRFAGVSKFNFKRKINLALDAILDFSDLPLRYLFKIGLIITIIGFFCVVGIISAYFFVNFALGWSSIFSIILLGLGIQLLFISILGLYIGRIYKEVKKRPLFSVKKTTNL